MNKCYICEYGWIIVGREIARSKDIIKLTNASVVRKWHNGKGIGGIVKAENKKEYTLDDIGNVEIRSNKVLFEIPCEW